MRKLLLASVVGCMLASSAQATVISFDNNAQVNNFTGVYSQSGYNVSYVSGSLRLLNDNPTFGDVLTGSNAAGGSFSLTRIDGGLFSIGSFLGGAGLSNSSLTYALLGYLAGANTYSETLAAITTSGQITIAFTPTPAANVFDRVNFSIRSSTSTALVDNINVTDIAAPTPVPAPPVAAVPEPATWAMMLVGFGLVGSTMRRRKTALATRVRFA